MTTGQQIKLYLDELGWDVIELARQTNIHHIQLNEILNDERTATYLQLMTIINKINLQYTVDHHWTIYQSILIQPTFKDTTNDTK